MIWICEEENHHNKTEIAFEIIMIEKPLEGWPESIFWKCALISYKIESDLLTFRHFFY